MIDLVIFTFGVGLGTFVAFYYIFGKLQPKLDPMYARLQSLISVPDEESPQIKAKEINILYGPVIGLFFGLTIIWGTGASTVVGVVFMLIGLLVNWFLKNSFKKTDESRLRAELAVLYEVIDFYTAAGYTLPQSLQLGAAILPRLNPIIQSVLYSWPQGSARALQTFADEIPLSEAEVLTSILIYIEENGYKQGKVAIEEEARQLELVRKTMSEIAIINKPLFYSVYRVLPVAALGGVVLGPLVYRITTLLTIINSGF